MKDGFVVMMRRWRGAASTDLNELKVRAAAIRQLPLMLSRKLYTFFFLLLDL